MVHHIEGVAAVCVDWVVKADGALDGIQGKYDIFLGDAGFFCNVVNGRFAGELFGKQLLGVDGLIGCVPQGAADPDGVVVPQVPPDFADNHRDCIS